MGFNPPKITKDEVSQEIDLEDAFGTSLEGMPGIRQAFGEALIERIQSRTDSSKGIEFQGNNAKSVSLDQGGYSDEYAESPGFRAFGKSSKVNLKLTGDMLGLIDIVSDSADSLKIGYNDADQNPKAYNHSIGDTVPKRPFFGVSKSDVQEVAAQFQSQVDAIAKADNIRSESTASDVNETGFSILEALQAFQASRFGVGDG